MTVFPGERGTFNLYEDNGNDKDYGNHYATTLLTSEKTDNVLTVMIGARKGNYPEMPVNRVFSVRVLASTVPESVTVNGAPATIRYDGNELTLIVEVPETNCSVENGVDYIPG